MKRNFLFYAAALALLMTAAASAQTVKVNAKIPFSFIVNGTTLPAGKYLVESVDDSGIVLAIRDLNQKTTNLAVSNSQVSANEASSTKLVFHRYGNRYFLSQVWVEGNNAGRELPVSSQEREVAKDLSRQEVVLAAAGR